MSAAAAWMSVPVAYLLGAIPFGYLAGKLNGIDLREHGSHNIGATNAVRVLGKKWGIPVFICDFLKGFLPVLWVKWYLGYSLCDIEYGCMTPGEMGLALSVLLATVLGHTFTCFLNFKGGKGVATMAGCLVAFMPTVAGAAALAFVLTLLITRYVSLSSLVAGAVMVLAAAWEFVTNDVTEAEAMALGLLLLIYALVVYRHRSNIARLWRGTEPKSFSKKK